MTTTNITIGTTWVKIADDGQAFLASHAITGSPRTEVEFAATAADAAPTVFGHIIGAGEALTRDVIGDGFIWARSGSVPAVILAVSK